MINKLKRGQYVCVDKQYFELLDFQHTIVSAKRLGNFAIVYCTFLKSYLRKNGRVISELEKLVNFGLEK